MSPADAERAAAERALQAGERRIAESHYREALYNAWMLRAALAISEAPRRGARCVHARVRHRRRQSRRAAVTGDHDLQLNDPAASLPILYELSNFSGLNRTYCSSVHHTSSTS